MRFIAFAMLAVALVTSAEPGRRKGFVRATWERRMLNSFGFDGTSLQLVDYMVLYTPSHSRLFSDSLTLDEHYLM